MMSKVLRERRNTDRRAFIAGAAAALTTPLLSVPAEARAAARNRRLSVTCVSFRDWFAQTPKILQSGRPAARGLKLIDFPQFVADQFQLPNAEIWSLFFEDTSDAYCRELRRAAMKAGVRYSNIQIDFAGEDLAAVDPVERQRSIDIIKKWMDRAVILGAPSVRANPDKPTAGRPFDPDIVASSYRELARYGAQVGVDVLIENHTGYSAKIDNVVAIFDRVREPRLKMLADWGNSTAKTTPDRIVDLSKMFKKLGFVSAKGARFDQDYRLLDYDAGEIVRATEAAGYRGIYSVELFTLGSSAPADPVRAVSAMLDTIRANLAG